MLVLLADLVGIVIGEATAEVYKLVLLPLVRMGYFMISQSTKWVFNNGVI